MASFSVSDALMLLEHSSVFWYGREGHWTRDRKPTRQAQLLFQPISYRRLALESELSTVSGHCFCWKFVLCRKGRRTDVRNSSFPCKTDALSSGTQSGDGEGNRHDTVCILLHAHFLFCEHSAVSSEDTAAQSCNSFFSCDFTGIYRVLWGDGLINCQLRLVSWGQLSQTNKTQERDEAQVQTGVGAWDKKAVDLGISGKQERPSWAWSGKNSLYFSWFYKININLKFLKVYFWIFHPWVLYLHHFYPFLSPCSSSQAPSLPLNSWPLPNYYWHTHAP